MASGRFFDNGTPPNTSVPDGEQAVAVNYETPRAMTAGVEQLDLNKAIDRRQRQPQAWQKAAWAYYKSIGEIKYAFGLTSNITSRARFYAGIIDNNDEPPVDVETFLESVESMESDQHADSMLEAAKIADEAIRDLFRSGQARLVRILATNLQVAGEAYLFDNHGKWDVASSSEITWGDPPRLNRSRYGQNQGQATGTPMKQGAFTARVYREDAEYAQDADSNMIGVLDACEQVTLSDQQMRVMTRSRFAAPMWALPAGTVSLNGKELVDAVKELAQAPTEDESALYTIVPLLVQLPDGQKIERLDLGRTVQEADIMLQEKYLQRILDGLDIPKDMVNNAEQRYSNMLAVNDNYYKGHIEPLIVLIADIFTAAYLRPMLHKAGISQEIIDRFVVWYNPAAIVTRPDRSASADTGYSNKVISAQAWRRAHGWSEHDAPSDDEVLRRIAVERGVIPPDMQSTIVESINPAFFAKARQAGQDAAGIPTDVAQLLDGGTATTSEAPAETTPPPETAPTAQQLTPEEDAARADEINTLLNGPSDGTGEFIETEGQTESTSGGELPKGGTMPPRPR